MMLNLLELFPIGRYGHNSAEALHTLIEAKKLAYADMARHLADPAFHAVPVETLLSKEYAACRAREIDPWRAHPGVAPGGLPTRGGDTTYLSAVDRDGNMVSLIQSNFANFGSGLVPDGAGFVLQSRGGLFTLDPAHPNALAAAQASAAHHHSGLHERPGRTRGVRHHGRLEPVAGARPVRVERGRSRDEHPGGARSGARHQADVRRLRRDHGITRAGGGSPRPAGARTRDRTARRVLEPGRRRPVREPRSRDRRQRRRLGSAQGRRGHPGTRCSDDHPGPRPQGTHDPLRSAIPADLRWSPPPSSARRPPLLHADSHRFVPAAFYPTFSAAHPVALRIKSGDAVRTTTLEDEPAPGGETGRRPADGPVLRRGRRARRPARGHADQARAESGHRPVVVGHGPGGRARRFAVAPAARRHRRGAVGHRQDAGRRAPRPAGADAERELAIALSPIRCSSCRCSRRSARSAWPPRATRAARRARSAATWWRRTWRPARASCCRCSSAGRCSSSGTGTRARATAPRPAAASRPRMDVEFSVEVVKKKEWPHSSVARPSTVVGEFAQGWPRIETATEVMTVASAASLADALQQATLELHHWLDDDFGMSEQHRQHLPRPGDRVRDRQRHGASGHGGRESAEGLPAGRELTAAVSARRPRRRARPTACRAGCSCPRGRRTRRSRPWRAASRSRRSRARSTPSGRSR